MLPLAGGGQHGDRLAPGDGLGDSDERVLGRLGPQPPVVGPFGPDQVAPVVWLPLGGHGEPVGSGGGLEGA